MVAHSSHPQNQTNACRDGCRCRTPNVRARGHHGDGPDDSRCDVCLPKRHELGQIDLSRVLDLGRRVFQVSRDLLVVREQANFQCLTVSPQPRDRQIGLRRNLFCISGQGIQSEVGRRMSLHPFLFVLSTSLRARHGILTACQNCEYWRRLL